MAKKHITSEISANTLKKLKEAIERYNNTTGEHLDIDSTVENAIKDYTKYLENITLPEGRKQDYQDSLSSNMQDFSE